LRALKREEAINLAETQLNFNHKNAISTHFFLDSTYPRRLRQCSDAPIVIYTKGKMDLNHTQIVSIVGTRNHTEYGKELLKSLLSSFKKIMPEKIEFIAGALKLIEKLLFFSPLRRTKPLP
jgi:DNA processing protein